MKIWAHRGCCYTWPENTLQSFEAASKLPVTGIELDIQLTKDRKMVVIHDEKVDRTTNGKGWVKDFTLEEIKALKIETQELALTNWMYPVIETPLPDSYRSAPVSDRPLLLTAEDIDKNLDSWLNGWLESTLNK